MAASVANLRLLILLMAGSNTPAFLLSQTALLIRSRPILQGRGSHVTSHVTYRRHNTVIVTLLCTTPPNYTGLSCDSHVMSHVTYIIQSCDLPHHHHHHHQGLAFSTCHYKNSLKWSELTVALYQAPTPHTPTTPLLQLRTTTTANPEQPPLSQHLSASTRRAAVQLSTALIGGVDLVGKVGIMSVQYSCIQDTSGQFVRGGRAVLPTPPTTGTPQNQ